VVEYFETAVAFNQQLPTFYWLQREGIVPSNSTKYGLSEIQAALLNGFGARPYVGCAGPRYNETTAGRNSTDNGRTIVSEAWYYYHTLGRVQNARGIPVDAGALGGSVSSCAKANGALTYPLRSNGSEI
jgi:ribonuclease T2